MAGRSAPSLRKTDSHYYDDKLQGVVSTPRFEEELALVRGWGREEKRERLAALASRLERGCSEIRGAEKETALHFFRLIVRDAGTPANYEAATRLRAEDLLLMVSRREGENLGQVLAQQLLDMRSGSCPQGRTHRLLQVISAFDV